MALSIPLWNPDRRVDRRGGMTCFPPHSLLFLRRQPSACSGDELAGFQVGQGIGIGGSNPAQKITDLLDALPTSRGPVCRIQRHIAHLAYNDHMVADLLIERLKHLARFFRVGRSVPAMGKARVYAIGNRLWQDED